ncbi:phage tail protein I [Vibrio parahaemolyticus]|uniref:phage tail protein I n=1 Tax=Vibrio parahaemolyticus TaxID=670 RepID=UPI00111DCB9A|nr:phage tail protein I [Vibrio parahaemolyticus]TOK32762.1 phage tail protein I [Vibrio parahaemolyticus]TOK51935.1 phage tail protein I [Vibrio parahaemolyticus]
MTDKTSLLPPNVSDLERDLEIALARIEDVEIPIATLWDPWHCPLEVLPFLAWALSVDMWRSDWPETVKRRIVASSLSVHRKKGTRAAVDRALRDLGVTVDLVEWFEAIPKAQRGTFDITAWVNENITSEPGYLNQALYDQLRQAVDNAKNTRSHYSFKVGAKFGPNQILAANAITGLAALARRDAQSAQEPLESRASIGAASSFGGANISRRDAEAKINAVPKPSTFGVVGCVRGAAVIYRQMEATA